MPVLLVAATWSRADDPPHGTKPPERFELIKFEAVHLLPTATQFKNITEMCPYVDEFTVEGRHTDRKVRLPHEVGFAAFDEKTKTYLALGSSRLFFVRPDKEKDSEALFPRYERVIKLDDVLPDASAYGCSFDSETRRLWILARMRGEFQLCCFDVAKENWEVISTFKKLDPEGFCHHPFRKSFFVLNQGHYRDPNAPELVEFSMEGNVFNRFSLSQPDLHKRIREGRNSPIHLHATKDAIIVFAPQGVLGTEFDRKHRSFILNLETREVHAVAH